MDALFLKVSLWSSAAFLATLAGAGFLLWRRNWAKKNIWRVLAFASGVLLGVAFLHILPEAMECSSGKIAGFGALSSLLLIFSVQGFTMIDSCAEYAEDCHLHVVSHTALGALTLHSILDGAAIALAFKSNLVLGEAVAVAILIHKATDGLTLTGLLMGTSYKLKTCLIIISLMALATPFGALCFLPMTSAVPKNVLGWGLGFIAGVFFYVGAADILPRLHRVKDIKCLVAFTLGLLLGSLHFG